MEQNEFRNEINIADLWEVFTDHIWQIVLAGLLVFALFTGYSVITYQAEYTSTATVYLIRQKDEGSTSSNITYNDFSLALSTVNDCTRTFKSHKVLDQVISNLGMSISYEQLSRMITITNPTSTRFLEISVTTYRADDAKEIVDMLCSVGSASIMDVMGIDQVNLVDEGTESNVPSNSMITPMCFIVGLAAAVIVYAVYLLIFMFNDKISTPDDIEKYFGLSVLGLIPNAVEASGQKYGKYGKYIKYGKYGGSSAQNGGNTAK
ncbi:MAG: hypothetical protein IJY27_06715 [Clostridia bacterium]|nr:hypothetical protein [Clostridia bacterium]